MAGLLLLTSCGTVRKTTRHAREIVSDVGDGVSDILTPDNSDPNSMESAEIPAEDTTIDPGNDPAVIPDESDISPLPTPMLPEVNDPVAPEMTEAVPETDIIPDTTRAPETTKAPETDRTPETTKAPENADNNFDEPEENASLWGIIVAIVVVIAIVGVVVMLIPKKRK